MPELIQTPTRVEAAGTKPKLIDEFVGQVNTGEPRVSVARMRSPEGWVEPGQRPEFDEWTVVLDGALRVEHEDGSLDVHAGQAILVRAGHRPPRRRMTADGLQASIEKMRAEGVGEAAIDTFAHYYEQLREGASGMLPESEIERVGDLPTLDDLPEGDSDDLDAAVVIKLNGGLGTSMGMTKAKSLIEAKDARTS